MPRGADADADLRLRVFGEFSLSNAGQEVAVPGLRSRALLAFLACNPAKPHSREKLAGLLWGGRFDEQARQSLRQALVTLRRILGDEVLATDRNLVELRNGFSSDVARFLALVPSREPAQLREAAGLYRGDLLSGFGLRESAFADWLAGERARLRDLAIGALETLMEEVGETPADLIELAQRAIALDPYREAAHRQLMRGLALAGRRNEALSHYRRLEQMLEAEFRVAPEPATREAADAVRAGGFGAVEQLDYPVRASAAGKPSIAVLPLDDRSGDPTQRHFADGITEDIITELSRFRQLAVLARNASFQYRDRTVDPRQIGRRAGVHYVLEGSVRRLGDRLRITVQLVDARSGSQVWAEHFDRDQQEVFAVQDEIVRTIVGTLFGRLEAADVDLVRRKAPASLAAYECVLRGKALPLGDLRNEAEKRCMFEKAIELDPEYGLAYALLAHVNFLEWFRDMSGSSVGLDRALDLAKKAVALDENQTAYQAAGWMYLFRRLFDLAEQCYQRSFELNPNNPEHSARVAFLYAYLGRPDEAIDFLRQARLIDPYFNPTWYWHHLGYAHFIAYRYEEAIAALSRSTTMPFWVQAYLAAAYALTDTIDRARAFAGEVLRLSPDFSSGRLVAKEPFKHPADAQHLLGGLRRAGLPE